MMFQKLWALFVICTFVILISLKNVAAVESLSAKELSEHCAAYPNTTESMDAQFCVRYIQGFIDGAIATDEQVMLNVEAEFGRKESFTERAQRTRGSKRTGRDRAAEYAEYCLGTPVPLLEVVNKIVVDLQNQDLLDDASITARAVVYSALRKHYPCKKTAIG